MSDLKKMCDFTEDDFERNVMLDDLHLAAELGKTLLERNKELETCLRKHQNVIEDQAQEIGYLTKQVIALREVNDSRLQIYEQLEVSIQDLERANHRLVLENSAEKKHNKNLNVTLETLESKIEEFQSMNDDLKIQLDFLKRKVQRNSEASTPTSLRETVTLRHVERNEEINYDSPVHNDEVRTNIGKAVFPTPIALRLKQLDDSTDCIEEWANENDVEQISQLLSQLSKARAQCSRDERRISELEEQLSTLVQQNQTLENQVIQLSHKEDDLNMKSIHEELTTLEEVRQGQTCSRCLRNVSQNNPNSINEDSINESSMLEGIMDLNYHTSFSMDVQGSPQLAQLQAKTPNPYKKLVEKYEALVEVHNKPTPIVRQEEMKISGDFKDAYEESGQHEKTRKTLSTPTDFSEAETSSSGFQEETSNKATQTEGGVGSFLCTIADGEDCKFSIYDDAGPIDSRFRDRPEYQNLFKEIFNVLKKAAENKDEGDDLPLLDDFTPKLAPIVPPVTPSNDQLPEYPDDDSQSVVSSTLSEFMGSQNEPTTVIENIIQSQNQPIPECETEVDVRELRPLVRQPLEYISVEVKRRSGSKRKNKYSERSESPMTHLIGSPKINYSNRPNSGRRRRERSNNRAPEPESGWNGNSLQFYATNRNVSSPTPSQGSTKYEFKPSTASQDLHKLKKLDMSYAEVLRNADTKKRTTELLRHRRK